MKKLLSVLLAAACMFNGNFASAQKDKSRRVSPPAEVSRTIAGGATVTINYGQPSVKGRIIGKDLEPMEGKVWRAGANEATVFETDKPITIEGKPLPAGKYAFFTKKDGKEWMLIFNKTWNTWGAYDYEKNKAADALKVTVREEKAPAFSEKLTYAIEPDGQVTLAWGDMLVRFKTAGQ
jgi:hypothetical protein